MVLTRELAMVLQLGLSDEQHVEVPPEYTAIEASAFAGNQVRDELISRRAPGAEPVFHRHRRANIRAR